jgi:hypothetical protein
MYYPFRSVLHVVQVNASTHRQGNERMKQAAKLVEGRFCGNGWLKADWTTVKDPDWDPLTSDEVIKGRVIPERGYSTLCSRTL